MVDVEADAAAGPSTKRAQRRARNDKNRWPQLPKVQSREARAKAYLRIAGLDDQSKVTPPDLESPETRFGRLLASPEVRKRHAAVIGLEQYLQSKTHPQTGTGLSQLDLLRLCKMLWMTLYLADQAPVVDELARRIVGMIAVVGGDEQEDEYAGRVYLEVCGDEEEGADEPDGLDEPEEGLDVSHHVRREVASDDSDDDSEEVVMEEIVNTLDQGRDGSDYNEDEEEESAEGSGDNDDDDDEEAEERKEQEMTQAPHCRGAHLAALWVGCWMTTIARDWGSMDKYRVDKFYTLSRYLMEQVYRYMARRHWNAGIVRLFNDKICETVFAPAHIADGLRLHIIDVALDELAKVNAKAPLPLTEATFLDVTEPLFALAQTGGPASSPIIQQRAVDQFLLKFLARYSVVGDQAKADEDQTLIFDNVHVRTVADFLLDVASDGSTVPKYRKILYEAHKEYRRYLKRGTDVELDDGGAASDEEGEWGAEEEAEEEGPDVDEYADVELVEEEPFEPEEDDSQARRVHLEEPQSYHNAGKKERNRTGKAEESEGKAEDLPAPPPQAVNEFQPEPALSKKNRKKKKKKGNSLEKADSSKGEMLTLDPMFAGGQSKKRKSYDYSEEQEITISLHDQKAAKLAFQKHSKKERLVMELPSSDDGNKRVKFGFANRARSYKASMKGLRAAKPVPKASPPPEKGILLNKGAKIPIAGKKKRRKAVDYF